MKFRSGTQFWSICRFFFKVSSLFLFILPFIGKAQTLSGVKTVGPTGNYTSIKAAVTAINAVGAGLGGPLILELQANYVSSVETFPVNIPALTGSSATNTVTIRPELGVTARTITSSSAGTINIDGGKNVIFDGRPGGVGTAKELSIGCSGNFYAFEFVNEASGNTIQYCKVKSNNKSTLNGTIFFSTTTGTNGNDNNTLSNDEIGDASYTVGNAVYNFGTSTTTATSNSGNTIESCNIFNFFIRNSIASGINLRNGSTDWTITGNSFYQTASRTFTAAGGFICININNSTGNNFTITNNYAGGSAANVGSTAWTQSGAFSHTFTAIRIVAGTTTPSSIQGNIIQNISITCSTVNTVFGLINAANGSINIGTVTGNTIGSTSSTGNIVYNSAGAFSQINGILSNSSSVSSIINISNNTIGGITVGGAGATPFRGISLSGAVTKFLVYKNLVGSETTTNSISNSTKASTFGILSSSTSTVNNIIENTIANLNVSSTDTASFLYGITVQSGINNVTGNTIRNLTSVCTHPGLGLAGINFAVTNTANQVVSKNIIHSLSNNNTTNVVVSSTGIFYNGPAGGTNKVSGNLVHSLNVSSSNIAASLIGISSNAGTTVYENNMIRLGIKADGSSISGGYSISGFRISGLIPNNKVYHNSVYIGGSGVSTGTSATYAFLRNTGGYALDVKNNIFVNVRANASAGGLKHYGIRLTSTDFTAEGTTINYNLYYTPGTDNAVGNVGSSSYTTIAAWRSATGFDISGISSDPNFINPSGDLSAVNLHVLSPTPAEGNGTLTSSVAYDYDSTVRSTLTPVDLGADAGDFTGSDISPVNIVYTPLGKGIATTSRVLTAFATIVDNVGVSGGLNSPRFYFKKSGDAEFFGGNTSSVNGWKYVTASSTSSPYSFTIDYSILRTAVAVGDVIQYFVIAQDDANNFSSLPSGSTAGSPPVPNVTAKPTLVNSYSIASFLSGIKTIPGNYSSLTGASGLFADINAKILSGNLSVIIAGNLTEDGTNALNQWDETGTGNYSVSIASDGVARSIAGTAVISGNPMININGADRFTISGGSGTQKLLTFRNTNTTAANTGATIQFFNGSTGCIINNCIIENNGSSTSKGSIITGLGNNIVTLSNNEIRDATSGTTGAPYNAIYASGATINTSLNITGNNIYNFIGYGINLPAYSVTNGCTISGNNIYQTSTAPATVTGSALFTGIGVYSGSGHTIQSNFIGGQQTGAAGSAYSNTAAVIFKGIDIDAGASAVTFIQGNKISNISITASKGTFTGISITAGTAIANGNMIGDATAANSVQCADSLLYGIYVTSLDPVTIQNDTTANITSSGALAVDQLVGIYANSSFNAYSITNNRLYNLKSAGLASPAGGSVSGIYFTGTNNNNIISRNRIYNLENTATGSISPRMTGIYLAGTTGGTISRNRIYNFIVATGNTGSPEMRAILAAQSNDPTVLIANNQVSLGNNIVNDAIIQGIADSSSTSINQNIYYNTVYVGGTVTSGASNCAAWSKQNAFISDVKNNIFYNERTGGTGSHYAVSFSSPANTASSTENYNLFVAGNAGKLAEFGSGVSQTFAQWKAATGDGANSITVSTSAFPSNTGFSSVSNGDLRLGIEYRYIVGAKGVAVSETVDFAGNPRNSPPGIGSIEYSTQPGVWIGIADTAWTNIVNWGDGVIPSTGTNVTIPTHVTYMPSVASGVQSAKDLTIQSGASLTVKNATLQIAGTITNSSTFTSSAGTIELNGTTNQTISSGLFSGNTIQNLIISNNVSLGGPLYLNGTLSFGSVSGQTFSTGGFLTLGSSESGTARVADVTNAGVNSNNSISGLVTSERYIPAKRAFRFLTSPVNATASIRTNWMENTNNANTYINNNPVPNYGTHISGPLGNANGFDATQTNNPSMYTYNNQTQLWTTVPNTSGLLRSGYPYRILVRGSRSTNLNSSSPSPSPTTLRATGTLVTGTVILKRPGQGGTAGMLELSSSDTGYSFIGNPYASTINWLTMEKNNISSTIYVFDPTVSGTNGRGAFVSYNANTGSNNNPSSFVDNNIQSWQSFFVRNAGANPSLTIKETHKTNVSIPVFRTTGGMPHLSVQLLLPKQVIIGGSADGFKAYFSDDFSSSIGDEDSYKFTNQDENMGILRDGKVLSIEGRSMISENDTIPLKIWQLLQSSYTLKFGISNFSPTISGYLEDKYLHTATLISSDSITLIPFSISADTASFATDRFRIVFKTATTLPLQFTGIKAYKKDKGSEVEWSVYDESNISYYEVERSADAVKFVTLGKVKPTGNFVTLKKYSWHDAAPVEGDNFYRIKMTDKAGVIKYSEVVKVTFTNNKGSIAIFPDPVEGNTFHLQLHNLDKGEYKVKLLTTSGQQIYAGKIKLSDGSSTHTVKINTAIAKGVYQLQVSKGAVRLTEAVFFK